MIKKHFYFAFLLLMGCAISFTSCSSSSDDDSNGGTLDTPAYKSVSAMYEITAPSSKYSSIEFTESGNYIIVSKTSTGRAMQQDGKQRFCLVMAPWMTAATRATTYGNIITGKYTMEGNKYVLEGFGTITVNTAEGTTVSLEIAETGATPYTLTAAKKNQKEGSDQTNKLCRSWKVTSLGMKTIVNTEYAGNPLTFNFDKTVDGGNLPELMVAFYREMMTWAADVEGGISQAQIDAEVEKQKKKIYASTKSVEGIIFSQAGTYMVTYGDSSLAIATWAWKDSNSTIQYSWNYNNMTANNVSGECNVEFKGSKCILTETNSSSNGIVSGMDMTMTYTLQEIK